MINVSLSVSGLTEAQQSIINIMDIMSDFSKETADIGEYGKKFFSEDVYDSQGAVYGSAWAQLSPKYATYKSKRFGAQPILVASGKMKSSYTVYSTADMVKIQNEAQNDKGEYYASGHQNGDGYLPQRLLMDLDDQRMIDISLIIVQDLTERITSALVSGGGSQTIGSVSIPDAGDMFSGGGLAEIAALL